MAASGKPDLAPFLQIRRLDSEPRTPTPGLSCFSAFCCARSDSSPLGRTKDSFIRWTQASALNPLFENGGQKEHRPWIFDEETYEIYRTYLWLHEELRPFYYSRGNDAFDQGPSAVNRRKLGTNRCPFFVLKRSPLLFFCLL